MTAKTYGCPINMLCCLVWNVKLLSTTRDDEREHQGQPVCSRLILQTKKMTQKPTLPWTSFHVTLAHLLTSSSSLTLKFNWFARTAHRLQTQTSLQMYNKISLSNSWIILLHSPTSYCSSSLSIQETAARSTLKKSLYHFFNRSRRPQ